MVEPVSAEALSAVLPLLGLPALVIAQLVVETPVLRREHVSDRRLTAAITLAIVCLVAAAALPVMAWARNVFGLLLLGGLAVPAVLTLVRSRHLPSSPAEGAPDGG